MEAASDLIQPTGYEGGRDVADDRRIAIDPEIAYGRPGTPWWRSLNA
jgi:hypothetical protein